VLKELATISTNISIETEEAEAALTCKERNGLRYPAGYVPRQELMSRRRQQRSIQLTLSARCHHNSNSKLIIF